MRRRRFKARFFVLIAVVAALAAAIAIIVYLRGGEITSGTMMLEGKIHPVIVREETVHSEETYGKIDFFVVEGEQVTVDKKIAEVYKYGYNDNVLQSFIDLRNRIKNYQVNNTPLKDTRDEELIAFDEIIAQKTQQICDIFVGKDQADLLATEKELMARLDERREFLKGKVKPDEKLTNMYDEEQDTLAKLETWKRDIKTTGSGTVSLYFDGFEKILNKDTLTQISPSHVQAAIKGNAGTQNSDTNERPLFRVVNSQQWYCAVYPDKKSKLVFVPGVTYSLVFDGYFDRPYEVYCLYTNIVDSSNMVYIFQINDDIGPFISVRHAQATVSKNINGLKVANRFINTVDNQQGVYVGTKANKRFIPVEILGFNGRETFIRAKDDESLLQAGMNVVPK